MPNEEGEYFFAVTSSFDEVLNQVHLTDFCDEIHGHCLTLTAVSLQS